MIITRSQWRHIILYKPYWPYILVDICLLVLSFFVVLMWFPLATQLPFQKYDLFALVFGCTWVVTNYLTHRYIRVKFMKVGISFVRLLSAALLCFGFMELYMHFIVAYMNYSVYVLLCIWCSMLVFSSFFLLLSHAYIYALNEEPDVRQTVDGEHHTVLAPPHEMKDEQQRKTLRDSIRASSSKEVLQWLEANVPLYSSNTTTLRTAELYNLQRLRPYRYDTIVNFMPLNQIRGINKMFGVIGDKLPDNGHFVCCFESQGTTKKKILHAHPPVISRFYYGIYFFHKRVLPKLFLTSRFYFDITEGKDRVLSRAEVLGRLYYCGFKVVNVQKVQDMLFVEAERVFRPQTVQRKVYGLLVKLKRIGKNGKQFNVYKFRTMHPYSEYLQQYIFDTYGLQEGGKLNHDIRVTTIGRFMRKYWIDELPMFINLFRGDMKLVGVRPLSKQYFSLYSPELQQQRIRHKPGLLPPFYADMPKTLEEIQASETRYLTRCETRGTFLTDFVYFWKILYTILFKHARSH